MHTKIPISSNQNRKQKEDLFFLAFIPLGALPEGSLLNYQTQNFPQFLLFPVCFLRLTPLLTYSDKHLESIKNKERLIQWVQPCLVNTLSRNKLHNIRLEQEYVFYDVPA